VTIDEAKKHLAGIRRDYDLGEAWKGQVTALDIALSLMERESLVQEVVRLFQVWTVEHDDGHGDSKAFWAFGAATRKLLDWERERPRPGSEG
jgi:hypothetical protein